MSGHATNVRTREARAQLPRARTRASPRLPAPPRAWSSPAESRTVPWTATEGKEIRAVRHVPDRRESL